MLSLKEGTQITVLGMAVNMGLTAVKGVGGTMFHSPSLLGEALHSASDLASDIVTLAAYRLSRRPPSATFHWGLGRLEPIGTIVVSGLLVSAGLSVGWTSLEALAAIWDMDLGGLWRTTMTHTHDAPPVFTPASASDLAATTPTTATPTGSSASTVVLNHDHVLAHTPASTPPPTPAHEHSHGFSLFDHSHGHKTAQQILDEGGTRVLSPIAVYIMLLSLASKELMFRLTMRVAKRHATQSSTLVANAWHHRADAASSLVALLGVGGAAAGFVWADPIGGLAVSTMIVRAGWRSLAPAAAELIDRTPLQWEAKLRGACRGQLEASLARPEYAAFRPLIRIRRVRARKVGPSYHGDLVLGVRTPSPASTPSLVQMDAIARDLEHALRTRYAGALGSLAIQVRLDEASDVEVDANADTAADADAKADADATANSASGGTSRSQADHQQR
ncbi:hypothetical protein CXG81DRAFT_26292 [Caulochytrium protostelioides]|uniref:Cation efflux protein transmembrane domain-containing protein n=1 Tax=Caulochytrium protostelioides TaxID=1555241 RepID=A0A4P9X7L6_9FUNG|nr:hypothetical protein CXG81DRAFT_26292 [Caulochytrium protostelioides]|eukprot:RKP01040.1 hypothetical protein CXG81DRAFT_26292 [Caulochytrium protostelioides]